MDKQYYIGIDIGSTASKVVVIDDEKLIDSFCIPTGWNSKETAQTIMQKLIKKLKKKDLPIVCPVLPPVMAGYAWSTLIR